MSDTIEPEKELETAPSVETVTEEVAEQERSIDEKLDAIEATIISLSGTLSVETLDCVRSIYECAKETNECVKRIEESKKTPTEKKADQKEVAAEEKANADATKIVAEAQEKANETVKTAEIKAEKIMRRFRKI